MLSRSGCAWLYLARVALLASTTLSLENLRELALDPVCKTSDFFSRLEPKGGQAVFHVWRNDLEGNAVHQAVVLQPLQCLREHPLVDAAYGAFIGSAGEGKIASAARVDYADAAVAVLTTAGHEGKTYELAGDSAYTLAELAAEISRQTGKSIPYKNLSPADYAAALTGAGFPAPRPEALASFDVEAAKGALFDDGHVLSKLIGRSTTSLSEAVLSTLSSLVHAPP